MFMGRASLFLKRFHYNMENNNATFLEDAAQNADLYIANQSVSMQI